jgi:aspartokinase-like uncharacterized kinase
MDAVVKAGGSLAENPAALKALCAELPRIARRYSILVVPGGGRFADAVREYDAKFALPPAVSHRLAILAMDQYGLLLAQITPNSSTFSVLDEAQRFSETGKVPIFLPSSLMFEDDPFEPSWDVTSDSIAAYIAGKLRARKLVLVTDVDGVFTSDPKQHSDAELLDEVSVEELLNRAERTSVDTYLPSLLRKSRLDCYVVNGKHPERLSAVLSGQQTTCTRVVTHQVI